MDLFTGIILYIMIYWLMLFAVLPWGNKAPQDVETGHVASAPSNPRLKQKFAATAVVAAVVWLLVFVLIRMDVIDFYDIAKHMSEEDLK